MSFCEVRLFSHGLVNGGVAILFLLYIHELNVINGKKHMLILQVRVHFYFLTSSKTSCVDQYSFCAILCYKSCSTVFTGIFLVLCKASVIHL
uniref:Uncharacterized protein n=1 Tax=Aegilops tauschii subsp. strangulata TaxID=200361 RepID=A0A453BBI9_AEGTS